ncbi:MAG: hypothetical protein AAFZ91_14455 [Pseudomonadota bacterium]
MHFLKLSALSLGNKWDFDLIDSGNAAVQHAETSRVLSEYSAPEGVKKLSFKRYRSVIQNK